MYIALRTGGGRGVFEIAGETATGLTSADLLGRELVFDFDAGLRLASGVELDVQGGKHRLRMETAEMQVQRQVAAVLLMPSPRRVNDDGSSPQVLVEKEYVIERINIDFANHLLPGKAFVVPGVIETRNQAHEQVIETQQRLGLVRQVWSKRASLPEPIRTLISQHERLVTSGQQNRQDCEVVVATIRRSMRLLATSGQAEDADPLTALVNHLELSPDTSEQFVADGIPVVEFDLGNLIRVPRRVTRAIVERRGQWSFRQGLLTAYGSRCQVTRFTGKQALEAAHIYPYSEGGEFTNDLRNGLLLRADIHTLFDLGLLKVAPDSLRVRIMGPLVGSSYGTLDGTVLQTGAQLKPSTEALQHKWLESQN